MKVTRLALTSLATAAFALLAGHAQALGLGRLNVQSSLGESLRAEIDVTSLSADEASSLQVRIASPETYRAAGVEYHPALASARVVLARRADGRPYLRLNSDRVVTEPFVDVILEMNWASGRLVREYTLLLDPPRTAVAQGAPSTTAPQVAAAPAAALPSPVPAPAPVPAPSTVTSPAPVAAPPVPPVRAAVEPPVTAPAARPAAPAPRAAAPERATTPERASRPAAAAARTADRSRGEIRVKRGDTLSALAQDARPEGVSLDQMLVSMFRTNPQAFAGENMNRLRSGAILKVPELGQVQAVSPAEARQVIVAQSADFDAYRRRLAGNVAKAPEAPSRQAGGQIQASVDDRKQAAAPTPDKLKLSQGAVKASAPEAKLSQEAAVKDASNRVAELSRNLEELKKVQGAAQAPASPAAKPAAQAAASAPVTLPVAGPVVKSPAPAPSASAPVVPPSPVVASASAPASAPGTTTAAASAAPPPPPVAAAPSASAPVVTAAKPPVVVPPASAPEEEQGLMARVLESPFMLPVAAGLAALLAGIGIWRVRARNRKAASETSFMESRMQPDSFFGQSGGQRVDTADSAAAGGAAAASSSMNYSLSQLDAIGDVDPVAEADVYLAYGRDLQAEEILKEAMRTDPSRLAVRTKLLEVYAKRRDVKGFEQLANQLFTLTRGEGPDWARAQELGRTLDETNPLYANGGAPSSMAGDEGFAEPLGASTMPHSVMPSAASFRENLDLVTPEPVKPAAAPAPVDVDIDLGFGSGGDASRQTVVAGTAAAGLAASALNEVTDIEPRYSAAVDVPVGDDRKPLDFDMADISLDLDPPPVRAGGSTSPAAAEAPASGFVDLSGLPDDPDSQFNDDGDPLERKLDLADEFRQIGDMEGARDLLNEVIAGADGALKQKAQTMLDSLG